MANLVATLAMYRELGQERVVERLEEYARLSMQVAEIDVGTLAGLGSVDRIVETGVAAMVLGDRLFAGLRHLARAMISDGADA